MIKISRRIELEDIVLDKENWKQVKNNVPCYFKASYGHTFWCGIITDAKEIPNDVVLFAALGKYKICIKEWLECLIG